MPGETAEANFDFKLTGDQARVAEEFSAELAKLSYDTQVKLKKLGLSEANANATVTNVTISTAATSAILTRVVLLGGEPSIEKWRSVTETAFVSAKGMIEALLEDADGTVDPD